MPGGSGEALVAHQEIAGSAKPGIAPDELIEQEVEEISTENITTKEPISVSVSKLAASPSEGQRSQSVLLEEAIAEALAVLGFELA